MTSGNVVHNLRGMDWKLADGGYDWARRFDEDAKARMLTDPTELATLDAHRDYSRAVPTPDHFIPALYLAGLAGATETSDTEVLVDGYAYGSLSMTAYTLGLSCSNTAGQGGSPLAAGRACHRMVPTSDPPAASRTGDLHSVHGQLDASDNDAEVVLARASPNSASRAAGQSEVLAPPSSQGVSRRLRLAIPGENTLLVAADAHDAGGRGEVGEVPHLLTDDGVDPVEDPMIHV